MRTKFSIMAILSLILVVPARASTVNSGKIIAVYIIGNKALVDTTGASTTKPACAVSTNWVFDLTTVSGQAKYASAVTAYATRANALVVGTGTCPDWPDRETIDQLGIVP